MRTQFESALSGETTPAMIEAARAEKVSLGKLKAELAAGRAVLPANRLHSRLRAAVVGRAFRTKINANIGRSAARSGSREEAGKLAEAVEAGADCVMDLSVGSDLSRLRARLIEKCRVPFGTVPVYEAVCRADGNAAAMTPEILLDVIRDHAGQGVDFVTLHAGLLKKHVPMTGRRVMGIVSRGGAILAEWMLGNKSENPLYERWDEVMEICAEHDVTVSLGDGLRPGCLADASDKAQFAELDVLGELVERCRARGVQAMVEGPGHIPFDQIQMNVERQQKVCGGAPFYVLGPVVTDIAPGYDHITSCIGATAAAYYGASLLCYVTPAEHLGLPTREEVRQGVIACRIAAHAADVARGLRGARDADDAISRARMGFDWEAQFNLALDGERARKRYRQTRKTGRGKEDHCSMCGREFCAVRRTRSIREKTH